MGTTSLLLASIVATLALTEPQRTAQVHLPPGDAEVRTWRDSFTGDRLSSLTLLLTGPKGPLSVSMVVVATQKAAAPAGSRTLRLDIYMPLVVGTPDYSAPHLTVTLNKGTPAQTTERFRVEAATPLPPPTPRVTMIVSEAALARMARARTIDGRIFGFDFDLTPGQQRALRDFLR